MITSSAATVMPLVEPEQPDRMVAVGGMASK
jgi:hypothetical protein